MRPVCFIDINRARYPWHFKMKCTYKMKSYLYSCQDKFAL